MDSNVNHGRAGTYINSIIQYIYFYVLYVFLSFLQANFFVWSWVEFHNFLYVCGMKYLPYIRAYLFIYHIKKIKFLMCFPVFISFLMIVRKWEFLMHYEVRMKNLTKCEKVSLSDVLTLLWNVRKAPRARSCAIDFQTKILLGLNKILKFPVHFQIFI